MTDEQDTVSASGGPIELTATRQPGENLHITVNVNLSGTGGTGSDPQVMAELQAIQADLASMDQRIEAKMSDLTGAETQLAQAVTDLAGRVTNDIQHLQDLQQQQSVIINDLQTQGATDQATIAGQLTQIADLQAQITAAAQKIADSATALNNIDPAAPVVPPVQPPTA